MMLTGLRLGYCNRDYGWKHRHVSEANEAGLGATLREEGTIARNNQYSKSEDR